MSFEMPKALDFQTCSFGYTILYHYNMIKIINYLAFFRRHIILGGGRARGEKCLGHDGEREAAQNFLVEVLRMH